MNESNLNDINAATAGQSEQLPPPPAEIVIEEEIEEADESAKARQLAETGKHWQQLEWLQTEAEDVEAMASILGLNQSHFDGEDLERTASNAFRKWLEKGEMEIDHEGTIRHQDDVVWIEGDDAYFPQDDCVEVQVRRGRTEWRLENDSDIFFCEGTREWYDSSCFSAVEIDGKTYCQERCDVFFWDCDGEYHLEPEPEPEPEEDSLGLSGYHGGDRSAVIPGRSVSVEIETVVGSPDSEFGEQVREICDACEEDSSLPTNGAEVIVGSTLFSEVGEKIKRLCEVFKDYDCHGHIEGKEGIGIHVSVSREGWGITNATLARMLILVGENKTFFERIAQRTETHWARYGNGNKRDCVKKAKQSKGEKYEAIAIRDSDRIEFRLFRSSTRWERIMKNVECAVAVVDYSKSVMSHNSISLKGFRQFIEENKETFPNLTQFITEKGI